MTVGVLLLLCIFFVVGGFYLLRYVEMRIDYQKTIDEQNAKTTENALKLEIEKEKTNQLQMKTEYREKYNSSLY
jgi:hypothetical protein